tara:strand:- start:940 stop:1416 length:477 start_codon:yes stop_codon:yes gene_type:complete
MADTRTITVNVNGEVHTNTINVRKNLIDYLRDDLGFTGSHVGCEHGVCGACTLDINGETVRSCLMLAVQADGTIITTIEGLADNGVAGDLKKSFAEKNALQCGYCTPGMLASAIEYINAGGNADKDKIRRHISGNYCRCTGYQAIVEAIYSVAENGGN